MAWVAHESFEGYTDESDLAGQNGGTGWGGAWVNEATNLERADTATAYDGTVSARVVSGGGNTFYTRPLASAISDNGVVYLAVRNSANNSGVNSTTLRSTVGFRVAIQLNASGNLTLVGTTTVTLLAGYSTNTWYPVRVTFNVTGNTATASYHNGTAWSTESAAVTMGNSGNIDRVGAGGDTGTGLSFLDYISGVSPISSPSPTPSPSISPSPSSSVSLSPSSSASSSISLSPSSSQSPSSSVSSSASSSASSSISLSPSSSVSSSISLSPSSSQSPSSSISPSPSSSVSASISLSPSSSVSLSPSSSASSSISPSPSASPSVGFADYTRGDYAALPADDADLETAYSAQDVTDVATSNNVRVNQAALGQYAIHQYKNFRPDNAATFLWEGQSDIAPSTSEIVLQIYNQNTAEWETKASNNTAAANTDFNLTFSLADLTNYKNASGVTACRVYQLSI